MSNPYKLTEGIKEFIITQKKANLDLSCRNLVALIEKNFSLKLSKSSINDVIKENNLNSPVGRKRTRQQIGRSSGIIKNGGCFFLKIADIKLALSEHLASGLSAYFPQIPLPELQSRVEFLIYSPLFEDKTPLWQIIGSEISSDELSKFSQALSKIPIAELNNILINSGFTNYNFNEINELCKRCLLRLNSYLQANFFLSSYQLLDFSAMKERFYYLYARVNKNKAILELKFFYPQGFPWANDLIWKEDFSSAVNKINQEKILNRQNEQLWIDLETLSFNKEYLLDKHPSLW